MTPATHQLALHGAVVLLIGLLCGAPYARAIKRGAPAAIQHAWRVAHASLPIGATLMFAVAALLPQLQVTAWLQWAIVLSLIVSGYAFCAALPLGAATGHRGLGNGRPLLARLVYAGNLLGAVTSLLASVLLIIVLL
ncbi:hypothetical protein SAMN02745857_02045 [Andreprevotia lacus DSM 23236]|jgi:hypothetical protein|uniref:DUF2269 family protein n=1 Tax=Andreprevotia lacus DSM 23236 TaxID=1121001 RepID=A0A1W1XM40_9NEIS|nr:hypothetical protein [Andreprevotia lacus]SMC25049.1 hypothetical protein SAMN02745857_02045 [Andreprevotia lacus DSM 23236]